MEADPVALRRILDNLLRNALESLPRGRRHGHPVGPARPRPATWTRSAWCWRWPTPAAASSPDVRERIFDDFFTTKPGGTGLGLSNVRRLAGDCGARLAVADAPGGGTVFTVAFPMPESQEMRAMSLILIIDDIAAMREQYAYDLKRLGGFETITATGGAEGLQLLDDEPIDAVILDLEMPGVDGFEVLATLKRKRNRVPIIVYTGTGSYDRCVRAVKLGAYSFLAKDEPLERVVREVENALAWAELQGEVRRLRRRSGDHDDLIGESRAAVALKEQVDRLAAIPSAVLVLGESGSGKELVARRLHEAGPRARRPFVAVNCAALPETMVESELFGHEKGAFTGADRVRKGAFEEASGGTLFLDEIGELPAPAQAKLLRVLEDGTVTRLGSHKALTVDTRVVAATNRNLDATVAAGHFRQDLLFRLNTHTVRVPPLRERLSDVPMLAEHFLLRTCERFGRRPLAFAPSTLTTLQGYDWARNNVRELRNVVERLVIAADAEVIGPELVPADVRTDGAGRRDRRRGREHGRPRPAGRHPQGPEGRRRAPDRPGGAGTQRLAHHQHGRPAGAGRPQQPAEDHAPPRSEEIARRES